MSIHEIVSLVLILTGAVVALIASIGLHRFPDVLTRMHAASKPQTLGLILITLGVATAWWTPEAFGLMLLVLLAQMVTAPVSSTMLARSAFRRGFVRGDDYAIDELTPRLAHSLDEDDDEDGFIDDEGIEGPDAAFGTEVATGRFPDNPLGAPAAGTDLSAFSNWDAPEPADAAAPEELDVEPDAIAAPAEESDEEAARRRRRHRSRG